MQTALNIPGGVVDAVEQRGGNVIVQRAGCDPGHALHQAALPSAPGRFLRPVNLHGNGRGQRNTQ